MFDAYIFYVYILSVVSLILVQQWLLHFFNVNISLLNQTSDLKMNFKMYFLICTSLWSHYHKIQWKPMEIEGNIHIL